LNKHLNSLPLPKTEDFSTCCFS